MLFRKARSSRLKVPRPPPRRGAFALEPVSALPRLWDHIEALAERSLESNPFFLPEFLEPAIQALGGKNVRLAVYSDRGDLRFFAPVTASRRSLVGGPKLAVWTHPYAPLGAPFIETDSAARVCEGLLAHMRSSGRRLLAIPDMPLEGPAAAALRSAADRRGFWTEAGRQKRPLLLPNEAEGAEAFDRMVTQKRRRELDRQLRKLCETGAVSMMTAQGATDVEAAFRMFVDLETAGWKGRRGTALNRRRPILEFARGAVMQLAQKGRATIDVMRVGEKPVAALIRIEHDGLSIPWKIAYDESFSSFSPGRQLICDETRRWLADPAITRVDPVCEEGNPLFAGLWRDSERYGTLLLSSSRWGIGARLRRVRIDLRNAAKRQAKALLRPRKRASRPARPKKTS
jgi:CelD/BcsL family acetyltransferase involved in cellulose biosynthesis